MLGRTNAVSPSVETIAQQSVDALVFNGLPPNILHRELIAELAWKYRLPSICWWPDLVENSGTYGVYQRLPVQ